MSVIESKNKSLKVKIPFTELPKYVPEIPIKKCDKIIKCNEIIGFNNHHGGCWSLVVLMFMLHSYVTGCEFQSKISKQEYDYSEERLNYYFPTNKVLSCMFKRDYIPKILNTIRIRILGKYDEVLASKSPNIIIPKFERRDSNICEEDMLKGFFDFFGYDGSKFYSEGATSYETFFLINLMSKTVLNRFISIDEYNDDDIIFSDNAIGYGIGIKGHAIGIFKCDNGNYFIVDNNYLFPFKFNEFKVKYNECKAIEDAFKIQEKIDAQKGVIVSKRLPSFALKYSRTYGIVISISPEEMYSFTSNTIDKLELLENIFSIRKYTLYTGNDTKYKNSSDIISYYYSVETRIIHALDNKIISEVETLKDEITNIDRQNKKSNTLLMVGIENKVLEEHFDLFKYLVEKHHPNLNLTNRSKETMLHLAIKHNCKSIFKYLIEHKARFDMQDTDASSQFNLLSRYGSKRLELYQIYQEYIKTKNSMFSDDQDEHESVMSDEKPKPSVIKITHMEKQDILKGNKKQALVKNAIQDNELRVNEERVAVEHAKSDHDYYDEYIKYKVKYMNLHRELVGGEPISIETIKNIFTKSKLYQVRSKRNIEQISPQIDEQSNLQTPIRVSRPRLSIKPNRYGSSEQPLTPSILNASTPYTRARLEEDFRNDDRDLALRELKDTDYMDYETEKGKFIEIWIADNMRCPVCYMRTLRRYVSDTMPVIDVVCINRNHNNGVRFFQIKTSNGMPFMGTKYFSKTTRHIFVGSKRYGEPVHSLDGSSNLVIGYICIKYDIIDDIIRINNNTSFIILPIIGRCMNSYYRYVATTKGKPIIEYNPITTNVIKLSGLVDSNIIQPNYMMNYEEIDNPLSQ
jgi:hypothetical protein